MKWLPIASIQEDCIFITTIRGLEKADKPENMDNTSRWALCKSENHELKIMEVE